MPVLAQFSSILRAGYASPRCGLWNLNCKEVREVLVDFSPLGLGLGLLRYHLTRCNHLAIHTTKIASRAVLFFLCRGLVICGLIICPFKTVWKYFGDEHQWGPAILMFTRLQPFDTSPVGSQLLLLSHAAGKVCRQQGWQWQVCSLPKGRVGGSMRPCRACPCGHLGTLRLHPVF